MKVVNILKDCQIHVGGTLSEELKGNSFYIMSDTASHRLSLLTEDIVGIEIPFEEVYNPYNGQDLTNRKVLALRHGGGGDILFMSTGIKELKRANPSAKFGVAIGKQYEGIIQNEPEIDKVHFLPLPLDVWNEYHYHLIFEGIIENNPEAKEYNAYDLFMKQMLLDITKVDPKNKIPKITLQDEERLEVKTQFPSLNSSNKKVGIQVATSTPIRTYPPYKFVDFIDSLLQKDYSVYLFGAGPQKKEINYIKERFKEENVYEAVTSLREAIALASYMNYIVSPDSMFIHIGAALGIPVMGIYGPFHSGLRMKYFENSIGIDLKTGCSPCLIHGNYPCPKGDPSPCFSLITKDVLVSTFNELENAA